MNPSQVQRYVMTYLESTGCDIIEKSPYHVTVKLSPDADKALTNRPYYWGYVERTGVPAQTMSFTFLFDPEAHRQAQEKMTEASPATPSVQGGNEQNQVLSRYFGHIPSLPQVGPGRILQEPVSYGTRRLHQIFGAAREGGSYVNLFEQPDQHQLTARSPVVYEPWLSVIFKAEFACDLKREELHWIGISLKSGKIVPDFDTMVAARILSPQLAGNMHVQPVKLSIAEAADALESYLGNELKNRDYSWAEQARERLREELAVIDHYYDNLIKEQEEEKKEAMKEHHHARRDEMKWQYDPKVAVSAINCGIFHLR